MKLFLIVVLAILASVYAEEEVDGALTRNRRSVIFSLYTRANPARSQRLDIDDARTITSSNFNRARPTRVVTHGWRGTEQQSAVAVVRAAYLNAGDYNVITVDWNGMQGLVTSPIASVRQVGAIIAEFMNLIQTAGGLNPGTTQFIGHSLGAHVISFASRVAGGNYQAVVGLDPAGPVFENNAEAISIGIQPRDAAHVQVIHTNAGGMGLARSAGDSDFYPNGGASQPGCILDVAGICAHFRAPLFFAESLGNPTGFRSAEDSSVFLGGRNLSVRARGRYTLRTANNPPFAMG